MRQSTTFAVLSVLCLSALAAPMPSEKPKSLAARRTHSGRGTYYNDGLGACGYENDDSDSIVALSTPMYGAQSGPGPHCDQWVRVTNTESGKTAYGMVRDECPGCGSDDLDMSISLFEKLGNLEVGVLQISWNFMQKGWSPS